MPRGFPQNALWIAIWCFCLVVLVRGNPEETEYSILQWTVLPSCGLPVITTVVDLWESLESRTCLRIRVSSGPAESQWKELEAATGIWPVDKSSSCNGDWCPSRSKRRWYSTRCSATVITLSFIMILPLRVLSNVIYDRILRTAGRKLEGKDHWTDKTCYRMHWHWPHTSNSHWCFYSACFVAHSAGRSRRQSSITASNSSENLILSLAMLFKIAWFFIFSSF
jgi:hypothetical protein